MTRRPLLRLLMDDRLLHSVVTLLKPATPKETPGPDSQNESRCEVETVLVNSFID